MNEPQEDPKPKKQSTQEDPVKNEPELPNYE